jgi:hypothetical protein
VPVRPACPLLKRSRSRFQTVPSPGVAEIVLNLAAVNLEESPLRWVIGEWVMGGKYSAEWWEKIAGLSRDVPAQDPASVVDYLIQATAHGARSPAKNVKRPGPGTPTASKQERSLAD